MNRFRPLFILSLLLSALAFGDTCAEKVVNADGTNSNKVPRFYFKAGEKYLVLEFLYDGLTRFEVSETHAAPAENEGIFMSPMVARTSFPGPTSLNRNGNTFETPAQIITVNPENLCVSVSDKVTGKGLTTLCFDNMRAENKSLVFDPHTTTNVYGLGQYFTNPGQADGDWVGRVWEPGSHGNTRRDIGSGGAPSYAQFPIMYALGKDGENYGLFLDLPYKQRWDFSRFGQWWRVDFWGQELRGYLISGKDLPEIRQRYMDLTGRPDIPPKKVFGLWLSEFGYENWDSLYGHMHNLRRNGFPIDGFAMDLQWYGNEFGNPDASRMGTLTWDNRRFPNHLKHIAQLRSEGIDLMPIEQSYVHHTLAEHEMMASRGFLAKDFLGGPPTFINHNPWWGRGGLIDWTDPGAGALWHDKKRMPLISQGINYHWTDLGEPEMFNPWAQYHGVMPNRHEHGDVHNVYNLMWAKSIWEGYQRNNVRERFYVMARAGTSGIQRFGTGMWSGDIGANMGFLTMHANAQMHMAMSGIDYYSSDIGGFFRWSLDGNLNELYTQWFARACLLDTPVRPHVWNLSKSDKNSPAEVGHFESNRENLRLRYELSPYYYTLAHRAHRAGEPIVAPMVYHYQWDPTLRKMGNQMMIGRDLLTGMVANYGETERNVYLPKGKWFDYHANELFTSNGQFLDFVPLYRFGKFKLPLFARAGAIIPKMKIDDKSMNILGQRSDGSRLDDLVVRVYPDEAESSFQLVEDDGTTTDYRRGQIRETDIWQKREGDTAKLVVRAAKGSYPGAPGHRNTIVELVVADRVARGVRVNGQGIAQVHSAADFERHTGPCYWNVARNLMLVKGGWRSVYEELVVEADLTQADAKGVLYFVCRNGNTAPGESIYVSGNIPQLGNWNPDKAIKLDPLPYPTWTGMIDQLPLNTMVQWKCLKRRENGGVVQWEGEPNHSSFTSSVYPVKGEGRL